MRRHALVTHIRMPTVDRDAGSLFVDYTIRFLLAAGWRDVPRRPGARGGRAAPRRPAAPPGVATYAGFDWAERILRSGDIDLADLVLGAGLAADPGRPPALPATRVL